MGERNHEITEDKTCLQRGTKWREVQKQNEKKQSKIIGENESSREFKKTTEIMGEIRKKRDGRKMRNKRREKISQENGEEK